MTEKRLSFRKPVDIDVVFEDEHKEGIMYLPAKDISLSGLYIEGEIPLRVGTYTFLSFQLPNTTTPVRIVGEIVRSDQPKGMGVRFVDPSESTIESITRYLDFGG